MIIALVKDLLFISKINESALQLNRNIIFIKNYNELDNFENNIDLIIIDLNFNEIKPLETIKEIKTNEKLKNKKIIAYCSHVQTELMDKAREFGIEVMPRSLFTKKLKDILI